MVAKRGSGWRLAPSLVAMVDEADRIAPRRDRRSDGSIGDAAHRNRTSDHNPSGGIVHALDLDHDPRGGFDVHAHARNIAARRDPRIKYMISNGQIWNHGAGWRRYQGGSNPHIIHAHFSVTDRGSFDTSSWFGAMIPFPTPPIPDPQAPPPAPDPKDDDDMLVLRRFHNGEIWLCSGLFREYISDPGEVNALMQMFIPLIQVENAIHSGVLLKNTVDVNTLARKP